MPFSRIALMSALMLGLSGGAWAQISRSAVPVQELDINRPGAARGAMETTGAMKLLAPNVGWATSRWGHLFWTTDGGTNWKDITPVNKLTDCEMCEARVDSVFFLDTRKGWALIANYNEVGRGDADLDSVILAHTTDAGRSWSETNFTYPGFDLKTFPFPYQSKIAMSFADPQHGWLLMAPPFTSPKSALLMTADGGRTWNWTPASPTVGDILLVTPTEGWMVGLPGFPRLGRPASAFGIIAGSRGGNRPVVLPNQGRPGSPSAIIAISPGGNSVGNMVRPGLNSPGNELYVTRDGAQTWQQVSLEVPEELSANLPPRPLPQEYFPVYDLPTFVDASHGYLSVTYSGGMRYIEQSAVVLFVTDDGGQTWKPDRFLEDLPDAISHLRSIVIDSTWIVCLQWSGHPTLIKVAAGARVSPDSNVVSNQVSSARARILSPLPNAYLELSFSTPTQGWLLPQSGQLLSTSDGGSTWTQINVQRSRNANKISSR